MIIILIWDKSIQARNCHCQLIVGWPLDTAATPCNMHFSDTKATITATMITLMTKMWPTMTWASAMHLFFFLFHFVSHWSVTPFLHLLPLHLWDGVCKPEVGLA